MTDDQFDDEKYTEQIRLGQSILRQYPTVSTEEELDALPFGSVILSMNWQPANGARPWDKRNWLGPGGEPTGKPWSSYASKCRSSAMMITSRGRKRAYAVLFNPEVPIPALTPKTEEETP